MADHRYFTLDEANELVPQLAHLMGQQMKLLGEIESLVRSLSAELGPLDEARVKPEDDDSPGVRERKNTLARAVQTYRDRWTRVEEKSGERADQYSAEFTLALDKEIVPKVFGALNLIYEPEVSRSRESGEREREANLGVGVALSGQVRPGVFIGAETRYLRSHEGLIPNALKGEALFLGPTFYTRLTANSFMSAAWNAQVAGRAIGEPGGLDLTNFERHQVRFRLGIEF